MYLRADHVPAYFGKSSVYFQKSKAYFLKSKAYFFENVIRGVL